MRYSICLLLWAISFGLLAQVEEESKEYHESFPLRLTDYVEVDNRYGDIEVIAWNKDSVRFDIVVKVFSEKWDWRKDMLDNITVELDKSAGFVLAETRWSEDVNVFRKGLFGVKNSIGSNDRIEVDYVIHIPARAPLEIQNRFGDVFMGNHDGELEVKVDHGDFRARELKNVKSLEVRYGRLKVAKMDKAKIELGSGAKGDIGEVNELMVESSSSELDIEEVRQLNIRSRNDDIHIERVKRIDGSFTLSDLEIEYLDEHLDIDTRLGSVQIQRVEAQVRLLDVNSSKSDLVISLAPDYSGRFDIETDEERLMGYPTALKVESQGNTEDKKRSYLRGQLGEDTSSLLSIHAESGSVEIGGQR